MPGTIVESWESSDYIRPINFFAGTDPTVSHGVSEPGAERREKEVAAAAPVFFYAHSFSSLQEADNTGMHLVTRCSFFHASVCASYVCVRQRLSGGNRRCTINKTIRGCRRGPKKRKFKLAVTEWIFDVACYYISRIECEFRKNLRYFSFRTICHLSILHFLSKM